MRFVGLRRASRWMLSTVFAIYAVLALGMLLTPLMSRAQDAPALAVATPELKGGYAGTVILVAPFKDQHVGVILNKPTKLTLADLFPEHAASKAVKDPVYYGGPQLRDSVLALVPGVSAPDAKSLNVGPDVWLVFESETIDKVIETTPNAARYVAGFVVWMPGELADELKQGMFVLKPFDKARVFSPDPAGMWHQLVPKKGLIES